MSRNKIQLAWNLVVFVVFCFGGLSWILLSFWTIFIVLCYLHRALCLRGSWWTPQDAKRCKVHNVLQCRANANCSKVPGTWNEVLSCSGIRAKPVRRRSSAQVSTPEAEPGGLLGPQGGQRGCPRRRPATVYCHMQLIHNQFLNM